MKKLLSTIQDHYSGIYKIFLFFACATFIVLLFPKEGKFKYEFQKGKPWMHDELIAPFSFAVLKSDDEVKAEKESALKDYKPFYYVNPDVSMQKRKELQENIEIKLKSKYGENAARQEQINSKLALTLFDSVYSKGVLEIIPEIKGKEAAGEITILKSNVAEDHYISSFYSTNTALEYCMQSLKKNHDADEQLLIPLFENILTQNIIYDKPTSERMKQSITGNISLTRGMIQTGERIISKGELVTSEKFMVLESLKQEYEVQPGGISKYYSILLGQIMLIFISITVLALFLMSFRKDIFADNQKILFILLLILLMVFITSKTILFQVSYLYMVPICIVPIIVRTFYDTRLALFVHIITIINIGFLVPNSFEFVFLELIAGIIAIISIVNLRKRSQLFLTSFLVFITYSLLYIGMVLMQEGDILMVSLTNIKLFAGSALLTLLSYPLILVFEKLFGFVTDVSLMELSDSNSRLLRQLAEKAPGTFQHSMQVANLAEEAIYQIGGNPLLVRSGALYHDIGKMDMPQFFSENQTTGANPHDELPYDESAKIIINHVKRGIEKAKKYNIPEPIIDFIRTHHGTKTTMYFYSMYLQQNEDGEIDEKKFTYHGPVPFSKETAVVMMADAIEAASRSMKNVNEEAIEKLVDGIIAKQIEMEQFVNADITFKDIHIIKKIFQKKLMNAYHIRVEYPG